MEDETKYAPMGQVEQSKSRWETLWRYELLLVFLFLFLFLFMYNIFT